MYFLLAPDPVERAEALRRLSAIGINAIFHYVPLHSSPAGRRLGRTAGPLPHTDSVAERLIRLPLWAGMEQADLESVIRSVAASL
jgi:dTDP-4-amino-4,6-dideoxygalactose transaminase